MSGEGFRIRVRDVQKDEGLVIHRGVVEQGTAVPGAVSAAVDADARRDITRHHSATHLMHAALTRVLGEQVEQQGSKVEGSALRFDFNHTGPMTKPQLEEVERWVNEQIHAGHEVGIAQMPIDAARQLGAKAQFGEKYGQQVRVISMGQQAPVSIELCGGCHVANTREIRAFHIVKEEAIAAGIRRLVAVAGRAALALAAHEAEMAREISELVGMSHSDDPKAVEQLAQALKVQHKDLPVRIMQMQREVSELAGMLQTTLINASGGIVERVDHLQSELRRLRKLAEAKTAQSTASVAEKLLERIEQVADGVPLLIAKVEAVDAKGLGTMAEALRARKPSLCVVLGR